MTIDQEEQKMNLSALDTPSLLSLANQRIDPYTTSALEAELFKRLENLYERYASCLATLETDKLSSAEASNALMTLGEYRTRFVPNHLPTFYRIFINYDIQTPEDLEKLLSQGVAMQELRAEAGPFISQLTKHIPPTPGATSY